ncbi:MAG: helix-turn-helix transcriptional regulator [Fidelibacterota bacterium]|nr:MAG: helix-turn-helix transcriptional regulator [Candidatus Neomarinimicrobiota bacterium]
MNERSAPNVGHNIRDLRKQQGMSLRTLANHCGLSINAISRIERGENSPTVLSLHRLATALEVPINALFREEAIEKAIFVKQNEGLRHQMEGMVMESLGSGLSQQELEPFLITIEPGSRLDENPVTHHGEEFVYCVEGEIEYCVADRVHLMSAGDSLIFKASQPHYWNNPTQNRARVILVFQASQAQHLLRHHTSEQ